MASEFKYAYLEVMLIGVSGNILKNCQSCIQCAVLAFLADSVVAGDIDRYKLVVSTNTLR